MRNISRLTLWVLVLIFFPHLLFGQNDTIGRINPLNDDVYMHPVDCITPYTLKKGEWIYAQSLQTLPFPSWAFVGVTDNLTVQIDLLPWIFGVFTELKKPIPSLNFRYRFNEQKGYVPTFAIETMFVYFWDTFSRFETPDLSVWEKGSYFHVKPVMGYRIKNKWEINWSFGADYVSELVLQNNDSANFQTKIFRKSWNPDFSVGINYRPTQWISYHIGFTYGSTLTYL